MESLDWFAPQTGHTARVNGWALEVAVEPLYRDALYYTVAVPGWYSFRFSAGYAHTGDFSVTAKVRCECAGVLQFKAVNRLVCNIDKQVVAERVTHSVVWLGAVPLEDWIEATMLCSVNVRDPLQTVLDAAALSSFLLQLKDGANRIVQQGKQIIETDQGADPTRSS